jgi:hypothetical protein
MSNTKTIASSQAGDGEITSLRRIAKFVSPIGHSLCSVLQLSLFDPH